MLAIAIIAASAFALVGANQQLYVGVEEHFNDATCNDALAMSYAFPIDACTKYEKQGDILNFKIKTNPLNKYMVEKIVPCNDGTEATDTNSSVPYDAAAGCSGALRELAKKQNKTYNAPYIKLFTTSPIFDRDNFPASIFEYSMLKFDNVTECENVMKKQLP